MIQFDVYLNNKKLQCVDKVKHLGITVHFNLVDDHEIRRKKGDFIGCTNSLRAQYGNLSSDVQSRYFNTYCTYTLLWSRDMEFKRTLFC